MAVLRHPRDQIGPLLREYRGPLVLIAIALVLILAGGGLTIATMRITGSPTATNSALVDPASTQQVTADVSAEVSQFFSYSYTDLAADQRAAEAGLTGQILRQYGELFSVITRNAAAQQLTVTATVVRAGVIRLSGDHAQVLVFLDQQATRRGARSSPVAAQLVVMAQRSDGRWRITGMESR
jgi:Mce-associated membrane protein